MIIISAKQSPTLIQNIFTPKENRSWFIKSKNYSDLVKFYWTGPDPSWSQSHRPLVRLMGGWCSDIRRVSENNSYSSGGSEIWSAQTQDYKSHPVYECLWIPHQGLKSALLSQYSNSYHVSLLSNVWLLHWSGDVHFRGRLCHDMDSGKKQEVYGWLTEQSELCAKQVQTQNTELLL